MIYHRGWYYLLVTHGSCCRGADSGYNIRVGRAKKVIGPFMDNMGVDMIQGGGKLFVGSSGRVIGPGHFGLFDLGDGVQRFSLHYEADLDRGGASVLDIRPLLWKDGWPIAGENLKEGTYQFESVRTGTVGAQYMVMEGDVPVVESGGKMDFQYGNVPTSLYTSTKVDRVLHDGNEVRLGDAVLVAHLTPGHTKGCTTWTMKVKEAGKTYNVMIIGSPNVNPGYRLVNNAAYPQIAADYEKMFRVLKSLPGDIFLGAHGNYFDLETKYARLQEKGSAAFVDPEGYKKYVADKEQAFKTELAKQRAALPSSQ